ncbi:hypothetical protein FCIRC_8705 [Fusarium circinatum]|uniref:Uncharacterized protein n=1 Tax=Fusarium circinatum TaxID=48490 RepID=A0A8H5TMY3_FUSCI|nr:hypothetical protein FCIRC_8705 [Fusarium circinatum]
MVDAKVAKARPTFGPNVRLILLEQASIASVSHREPREKGSEETSYRSQHTHLSQQIPNMQVFHANETCRGVVALLWYDPSLEPLMQLVLQKGSSKRANGPKDSAENVIAFPFWITPAMVDMGVVGTRTQQI